MKLDTVSDHKDLTLSVFIITYNHEEFIAQALNGIVEQETNFSFEVVIGEDCSSDNTRKICEKFAEKYDFIRLLPELSKNLGMQENALRTIRECKGKYVAICEGDDYWLDKNKLQKQVDYLEKNDSCRICGHLIYALYKEKIIEISQPAPINYNQRDLIYEDHLRSLSIVYRNIEMTSRLLDYPVVDWFLFLYLLNNGYAHVLPDRMAVYRVHGSGVWSSKSKMEKYKATQLIYSLFKLDFPHLNKDIELAQKQLEDKRPEHINPLYNYMLKIFRRIKILN